MMYQHTALAFGTIAFLLPKGIMGLDGITNQSSAVTNKATWPGVRIVLEAGGTAGGLHCRLQGDLL